MHVVWISHNSDIGGAELCLAEGATSLAAQGMDTTVVLPWDGELALHLRDRGIPVVIQKYRWWVGRGADRALNLRVRRAIRNVLALPGLIRQLRSLSPDLVISNTLATPVGALAAKALGIPHLWYILELGEEDMQLPFDWGVEVSGRLMNWLSAGAMTVSFAVRDKFERWFPRHRMLVIYNAVEVPARPPVELPTGNRFRMVVTGAKHPGKRQEDAIRAVALLREAGVDCELTLAGREDVEYGRYLRELVSDLGLSDRVAVKNFVPDAFAEIERAHVFVMPSNAEAFGRVTIEAMKLGRPVVGTNAAGTAEFIREGWNGFLYPPRDVVRLAERLKVLAEDRSQLVQMGENARRWANDRFTRERFASELNEAVRAAVGERRR